MRIAITADVPDENSPVSVIFGRCPYYAIYDASTDRLEFIPNPGGMTARGAGVQAGQFLMEQGVQMVITGGIVGPNASMVLAQAGIQMINSFHGSIRDAIEGVRKGELSPRTAPQPYPQYGYYPPQPQLTKEDEIRMLEEEKTSIEERLKEIKKRLEELKE